ncbi:MAG: apolipoprotein N-acyltransferase [Bifidobacteriaceae bacterium]|nr:apolipoprotein N-acyltransferase [Bifidobacteriaceae bacterium]
MFFFISIIISAVDGIVLSSAFPDFSFYFLAPIVLAILYFILKKESNVWKNSLYCFIFALSFFIINLQFIAVAYKIEGQIVLAIFQALYFAILGFVWTVVKKISIINKNPFINGICFSILYTACDYTRCNYPLGGFAWASIAYTQSSSPIGKLSYYIGQIGVVFVVAILGVLLYNLAVRIISLRLIKAVWLIIIIGVVSFLGSILNLLHPIENSSVFSFAVVQGNMDIHKAGAQNISTDSFENNLQATKKLINSPKYKESSDKIKAIFWSESAIGFDPLNNKNKMAQLQSFVNEVSKPFIIGANNYNAKDGAKQQYNSVFIVEPNNRGIVNRYDKQHLVPFGEYIPQRDFWSLFDNKDINKIVDFSTGLAKNNLQLENANIGVKICFEIFDSSLISEAVKSNANIFFFPSNNSNFGFTPQSAGQLQISQFRAVENRKSAIISSLSGISATINPNGVVEHKTSLYTSDSFIADLPLNSQKPPYLDIEPALEKLILILTICLTVLGVCGRIYIWKKS